MGCGQSRMGMVYPRKWKAKTERRKGKDRLCPEDPRPNEIGHDDAKNASEWEVERRSPRSTNNGNNNGARRPATISGPILAQVELSASQLDFFRMLDEKIENGYDYDSEEDGALDKRKRPSSMFDSPRFNCNSSLSATNNNNLNHNSKQPQQHLSASSRSLSSWPNGSLTDYHGENLISRSLRSPQAASPESPRRSNPQPDTVPPSSALRSSKDALPVRFPPASSSSFSHNNTNNQGVDNRVSSASSRLINETYSAWPLKGLAVDKPGNGSGIDKSKKTAPKTVS